MSQKVNITMPKIPTNTPKNMADFATFLLGLDKLEDMSCKTWEKIPGCYSIKYRGKIIGEFYLSTKSGTYRISTRSAYFKKVPKNGSIIKNGLDLNVAKCDNIGAGTAFIRNVCHQIIDKASGKEVALCEANDFQTSEKAGETKKAPAKKNNKKNEKVFVQVVPTEEAK